MVGARLPFEKEASQLYREVLRSLEDREVTYSVDDYLSTCQALRRNPVSSSGDAVYYTMTGVDHSRSLTYLVNTKANYSDLLYLTRKGGAIRDKNQLGMIAQRVVSGTLAMRAISGVVGNQPPIDVSFILLGDGLSERKYGYIDWRSLRNAIMVADNAIGSGTHLVIIETTDLRVCNVHKGCLIFKLIVKGHLHSPPFAWLGDNPWEALIRFEKNFYDFMKPKHELYPLEYGKALPSTLSSFLIGYPTVTLAGIDSSKMKAMGGCSCVEFRHYVSLPPEFSTEELKKRLLVAADDTAKSSGCEVSIQEEFLEEPYHEDPSSPIVNATSAAFRKLVGFEPIFEWLPFPVSSRELRMCGFAKDIVAFGPGDWTLVDVQNERSTIGDILRAMRILSEMPYEVARLDMNR